MFDLAHWRETIAFDRSPTAASDDSTDQSCEEEIDRVPFEERRGAVPRLMNSQRFVQGFFRRRGNCGLRTLVPQPLLGARRLTYRLCVFRRLDARSASTRIDLGKFRAEE